MKRVVFLGKIVWILMVLLAVAMFIIPGCATGGGSAVVKDGVIELEQARLDFGENQISGSSKSSLTVFKPKQGEEPDGLTSALFEFYLDVTCDQPVTISIPLSIDEGPTDEDEVVMLGLGNEVTLYDGTVDTIYTYVPAEVGEDVATSTFIPAEYFKEMSVRGASSAAGSTKPSRECLSVGFFRITTTFENGGHFIVYFPRLTGQKFFLDTKDRLALLSDLEAVYNEYLSKGYTYEKRKKWPMEVHIRSLNQAGYYTYRWDGAAGKILLNSGLFEKGYQPNVVKPLLAHEFFHFVQLNYVDSGKDLLWFDEATATYFEGQKAGRTPDIINEYEFKVLTGVFPGENDAANGYARMPLVKFLSQKLGENFILEAYTAAGKEGDWEKALLSSTGPPSTWAGDFYEAQCKEKYSNLAPVSLHDGLLGKKGTLGKNKDLVGTKLELTVPTAQELDAQMDKGEEAVLGSATVNVGAYGAQMVAITIDEKNWSRLPDDVDPMVSVPGADARVFAAHGSSVKVLTGGGGGIMLDGFKKLSSDFEKYTKANTRFLVLVTGLHDSGKKDYTVTVGLPAFPTLDELVGRYTGGNFLVSKVQLSDELMAKLQAGDGGDSGCDRQLLAMILGLEGEKKPVELVVKKTGDSSGTLEIIPTSFDNVDTGDGDSGTIFPFNYGGGRLEFDYKKDDDWLTGFMTATYGKNKDINLDGTLNISNTDGSISLDLQLDGSKPPDGK